MATFHGRQIKNSTKNKDPSETLALREDSFVSWEIALISCDTNTPGDGHAAQRKAAALPCGGAQSPVRSPVFVPDEKSARKSARGLGYEQRMWIKEGINVDKKGFLEHFVDKMFIIETVCVY